MPSDSATRIRLDAIDQAYRALKDKGGAYRLAWQTARMDLNATPSTDAGRELAKLATQYEAALRARAEAAGKPS